MRTKCFLFGILSLTAIFMFAVTTTQAAYSRGHVSPSSNGSSTCPNSLGNCVNVSPDGTMLTTELGGVLEDYQIVGVGGITPNTIVDFTFNGSAPGQDSGLFSVIACGYLNNDTTQPSGIYDSNSTFLSGNCTPLGTTDNATISNLLNTYLSEVNCPSQTGNMVCLKFSAGSTTTLPGTWFFAENLSTFTCAGDGLGDFNTNCQQTGNGGPTVSSITELIGGGSGGGGGTPTPEPATMTLLAAGVIGLRALRRKRAA